MIGKVEGVFVGVNLKLGSDYVAVRVASDV